MKKIFSLLMMSLLFGTAVQAQDTLVANKPKTANDVKKPSRDHVMLHLSHDRWMNVSDSVHVGGFGRGVGLYLCYDFPIGTSNFSFAAGVGFSAHNIYFKDQRVIMNEGSEMVRFQTLDSFTNRNYRNKKLTTAYFEAPLELRYFSNKNNRNRGLNVAIGAKIGYNGFGGAHYKERVAIGDKMVTQKVGTRRYIQPWILSPTFRIGWGNFTGFVQYAVTPLFNTGQGPEVRPFSVGLSISGL